MLVLLQLPLKFHATGKKRGQEATGGWASRRMYGSTALLQGLEKPGVPLEQFIRGPISSFQCAERPDNREAGWRRESNGAAAKKFFPRTERCLIMGDSPLESSPFGDS